MRPIKLVQLVVEGTAKSANPSIPTPAWSKIAQRFLRESTPIRHRRKL